MNNPLLLTELEARHLSLLLGPSQDAVRFDPAFAEYGISQADIDRHHGADMSYRLFCRLSDAVGEPADIAAAMKKKKTKKIMGFDVTRDGEYITFGCTTLSISALKHLLKKVSDIHEMRVYRFNVPFAGYIVCFDNGTVWIADHTTKQSYATVLEELQAMLQ